MEALLRFGQGGLLLLLEEEEVISWESSDGKKIKIARDLREKEKTASEVRWGNCWEIIVLFIERNYIKFFKYLLK